MKRSVFLKTLAALLAGTHAAGPVSGAGWPDAERRRVVRKAAARDRDARPALRPAACP
ncbi:hypothetical protein [Lysobacter claricitrinus]|uniref:hypothetical protein n=1 Tax=Lysobacter claricitrinus TaxID=3367728 RepID=UPI0037DAD727